MLVEGRLIAGPTPQVKRTLRFLQGDTHSLSLANYFGHVTQIDNRNFRRLCGMDDLHQLTFDDVESRAQ